MYAGTIWEVLEENLEVFLKFVIRVTSFLIIFF